jgi:uncharacterized damage-inducible protein DinB
MKEHLLKAIVNSRNYTLSMAEFMPPEAYATKLTSEWGFGELLNHITYGIHWWTENYGAYAALDHVTHHRGQCVLFFRSRGIEPPEYIY